MEQNPNPQPPQIDLNTLIGQISKSDILSEAINDYKQLVDRISKIEKDINDLTKLCLCIYQILKKR